MMNIPLVLLVGFVLWLVSTLILVAFRKVKIFYPAYVVVSACLFVLISIVTAPTGLPRALDQWTDIVLGTTFDRDAEYTVNANRTIPGTGIYLLLTKDGEVVPKFYGLPWDAETAEALEEAMEEAEENGTSTRFNPRIPTENSLDNRPPMFYALPQPQLPLKPERQESPVERAIRDGTGQGI